MAEDLRARLKQWLASGEARLLPLTFPQRELWETALVPPGDASNNIGCFFEIKGPVTHEQCEEAVRKTVQRQGAMRTSFLPGKEKPLQIVRSTGETILHYRELSESEATPEGLDEVMLEGIREPFDMVGGPLYRLHMLRRAEDDFVIALTIHHAVADGWTLGAFVQDLATAYIMGLREKGLEIDKSLGLREFLPPLPMSYAEWGAIERKRWTPAEIDRHASFWKERLAGSKRLFDGVGSAADRTEPLQRWFTSIPAELADAVRALARRSGATLFSTLLAAFQIALNRWMGADDIIVGTPVANRNKAAVAETMGYFSGIVPLRGQVDRDRPFADALSTVHTETMDAFAHAMPFAELAKAVGEPGAAGHHAVFDVRFALQNHPIPDMGLPGISTKLRTYSTGTARFDLGCELTDDDGGFELVWLSRPSVVADADLKELDGVFRAVLAAVCDQPDVRPSAICV